MKQSCYKSYDELPLVLSAVDVSAALCISRSGAYELMKSKGFPSLHIGARIIVPKSAFVRWLDQCCTELQPKSL